MSIIEEKKILILGGNGLVGSDFDFGDRVTRKDANLLSWSETNKLIENHKPDWVINCAGFVGGLKANMEEGSKFFENNLLINMNVIRACKVHKVPNLISFLSTCIFPEKLAQTKSLEETDLHLGEPHESNYPYAYSKRMIDVMSRISRKEGFNYMCIIPTNLYGRYDNYNLDTSHLIPALIHKGVLAKKQQLPLPVWGSGEPIREFVYSYDLVRIIRLIIEEDIKFDNLIVSEMKNYSIRDIAETIVDMLDIEGISFNTEFPDGQLKKTTNNSKFNALFPNFEFTPLRKGLQLSIDYFKDKYDNDRYALRL